MSENEQNDLEKIRADIAKIMAETMKLNAEHGKITKEIFWYPVVIATGFVAVIITLTKLFL